LQAMRSVKAATSSEGQVAGCIRMRRGEAPVHAGRVFLLKLTHEVEGVAP
jgi:hypothetical protein